MTRQYPAQTTVTNRRVWWFAQADRPLVREECPRARGADLRWFRADFVEVHYCGNEVTQVAAGGIVQDGSRDATWNGYVSERWLWPPWPESLAEFCGGETQ